MKFTRNRPSIVVDRVSDLYRIYKKIEINYGNATTYIPVGTLIKFMQFPYSLQGK